MPTLPADDDSFLASLSVGDICPGALRDLREAYEEGGLALGDFYKNLSKEVVATCLGGEAAERAGARLMLRSIEVRTPATFSAAVERLLSNVDPRGKPSPLVSEAFAAAVAERAGELDALAAKWEQTDRDLSVFAISTLEKAYLLRDSTGVVERPVYMYLRVAVAVSERTEDVAPLLEALCRRQVSFATPVMFNAGCHKKPSLASCFLYALTDEKDSVDGIFKSLHDCARISHVSGGLGLSLHGIRAKGSPINGGAGTAHGVLPVMQLFNAMAKAVDQGGGRRRGSCAVYLETHHPDLPEFLEARLTYGNPEMRTHDLFTAVWVPDLFMRRVEEGGVWSFFCPHACPGLSDVWGAAYEELYAKYEAEERWARRAPAREVFHKIVDSQANAGMPYLLFKDACNRKSNQRNLGTIRSSNLCAEIVQYSDARETAVCNLASLCLPRFFKPAGTFDFAALHRATLDLARHADRLVDVTHYPTPETRLSNERHRPVGIGTQGLADCLSRLGLPWGSEEALAFDEQVHAVVYHAALTTSSDLARDRGVYPSYRHGAGSPASRGLLQFDLWTPRRDPVDVGHLVPGESWEGLKGKIARHGLRNSLSVALMPTATTAQIAGNSESIEPYSAMLFTRGTLAGDFVVANPALRDILTARGAWDRPTIDAIIKAQGSVQGLDCLSREEKAVFKTAWEVSQKCLLEHAARRGRYICQSTSLNIHMRDPTRAKLTSLHFTSWKLGLKTSSYYIRTASPASAIQFSVERERAATPEPPEPPGTCESCSA